MHRYLNVTDDIKIFKKGTRVLEVYNGDRWFFLAKQTDEILVPKPLRHRVGGSFAIKNLIGIE